MDIIDIKGKIDFFFKYKWNPSPSKFPQFGGIKNAGFGGIR